MEFLTKDETERLVREVTNPKHRVQILLMADAGLRVSEVCTLQWSDLDFRKKLIRVKSLKKRKTSSGKEAKSREIPLSDRLYEAFVAMVGEKGKTKGYVFPGNAGNSHIHRNSIGKMLKSLVSETPDLPHVHPHKLRHTFATTLRANGAELEDIKDLLGHEKLDTSLIYAHADKEKLRMLIESSAPKPSVWERLKNKLFPKRKRRINIPLHFSPALIGRDSEVRQLEKLLNQGISTLVVGEIGVGKSFLIDSLKMDQKVMEIDDTKEFKKSIAGCLVHLLGDKEEVAKLLYNTDDPESLRAKVSKESLPNLCKLLMDICDRKTVILKINDLDGVTPGVVKALEMLKDHFIILGTARSVKMNTSSFLWDFEKIELKPLSRVDSLRLFHRLTDDLELQQTEWIQNKIYDTSEGNPRMITELSERIHREPVIDAYVVDELCNNYLGRQTREIDISPYLLLLFGSFMVLRYVGKETGEKDLQFLGGCIMILMLFARYFFKGTKRKNV